MHYCGYMCIYTYLHLIFDCKCTVLSNRMCGLFYDKHAHERCTCKLTILCKMNVKIIPGIIDNNPNMQRLRRE